MKSSNLVLSEIRLACEVALSDPVGLGGFVSSVQPQGTSSKVRIDKFALSLCVRVFVVSFIYLFTYISNTQCSKALEGDVKTKWITSIVRFYKSTGRY